jgi:hypothetical protein
MNNPYNRIEEVPTGIRRNEYISSYIFDGEQLYYLAGPFCDTYGGECDGTLRVADMDTGKVREITHHVTYAALDGFDASRMYAYVSNYRGDAGCFSISRARIDLRTGHHNDLPGYGGCSDEDEAAADAQTAAYEAFLDTLVPQLESVNRLTWDNGLLKNLSPVTDLPEVWNYISVY